MAAPKNNQHATKHGGEAAVRAISKGEDFKGLAKEAENNVYAELSSEGRASLVLRNAARLQAAADLFWQAVLGAAEDGDLKRLDTYIKRFGWLSTSALRAWAQVKAEDKGRNPVDITDLLKGNGGG